MIACSCIFILSFFADYYVVADVGVPVLLGNVACNFKKKSMLTQDLSRTCIATRGGECDLRTLVDRQRKHLDDVVVRLHGPTDQAPKLWHLPVLAHVQLDDDPRTPIQQSVGEEFRQHDGVVTILMYYHRRASPKHRYNMAEVEYGGGGHRTRLRNDP